MRLLPRGTASGSHAEDEGEELFVTDGDDAALGRVVLSERTRQSLEHGTRHS